MKGTERACALAVALLLFASRAQADGDAKARAKAAYARGVAAHDAKDYPTAARAFAEADTLLPSPSALAAALDDAVNADDVVLGAELLERAKRPGGNAALAGSAADAQKKLGGRAAKIRLLCPSGSTCSGLVDDRTLATELWVTPGMHVVTTRVDGDARDRKLDVNAGETIDIAPERAAPKPAPTPAAPAETAPLPPPVVALAPAPKPAHGLPPAVVYIGGALTLAFVGGAVATGVVAESKHSDFDAKGCSRAITADCQSLHDVGFPLVIMTNVFIGLAALSGAATAVLAIGFTQWKASAAPTAGGFMGALERRF